MIYQHIFVVLCCIPGTMSDSCLGDQEKSIISGIKSSLKKLEHSLNEKSRRCPDGWREYKNHCYFFSSEKKSWHEAEGKCRKMGGYLVKVTSSAENSWLVNTITSKKVIQQNYWIGAADFKETEWTWVIDLSKLRYSNWNSGQPNNAGGNEDCAHFYKPFNYKWNDMPCNYTGGGYICESENGSHCLPYHKLIKRKASRKQR
ncbi:C-type lectin domain family 10 member A [Mytilus galloprovincialis]|uniref:C-type lectin domain family 10 member A n=2 Tax=Mytilus galloprovincialis TaxID=29158 RepID=A0A8B6BVE9_MYTGA|nr:C-type lectin domain family 10 member A [Mytilus galloprovincialis]